MTIYEVVRIIESTPLFLEEHLTRLHHSALTTGITIDINNQEIKNSIAALIKKEKKTQGNIKIIFTDNKQKNHFQTFFIPHHYPADENYQNGVKAIFLNAERKMPNVKMLNPGLRQQTDELMQKQGLYEILLVDCNGNVTEGSRSNIFTVNNNIVFTPPARWVLPGITRMKVLKICHHLNIPVKETNISQNDFLNMEAAFITGTSPKVLPLQRVNRIGFDVKNPLLKKIMTTYNEMIESYIKNHALKFPEQKN